MFSIKIFFSQWRGTSPKPLPEGSRTDKDKLIGNI